MNALLEKLSSYNLLNYLLPGVLFVVVSDAITCHSFVQEDFLLGVVLYYFIGLVISRIGSLVIEPVLRSTRFVRFAAYTDFVSASQADPKLELLSETNNMYRTFCALFCAILLLWLYDRVEAWLPAIGEWKGIALVVALLVMFMFAYRKQTRYITQRIGKILEKG